MSGDQAEKGTTSSDEKKSYFTQYLASATLSIVMFLVGMGNGWSSPFLAKLTLQDSIDGIPRATDEQLTWVASLMNIGRIFGAVLGAIAQDTVGRKMSLYYAGVPLLSGWVCILVATSIEWLYVARLAMGVSMGMIWTTIALYLAEIADPEIRGALVVWNVTCQSFGLFVGNVIGPYISMSAYAIASILPNLAYLLLFPLIPDSPYRYVMIGKLDEAERSLQWFRRRRDVKQELVELQDYVTTSTVSFTQRLRELKEPRYLKCFGLMFVINVFHYFGAYNVINSYMEIIVTRSGVDLIKPSSIVSIVGFFSIVSGLMATCLVDRYGRRLLLIFSSFGMATSLSFLGLHFYLVELGFAPESLFWLPCACLLFFTLSYSAGCGCIPNTLVGELFSPRLKTIASLSFSGTAALFSSLSTGTFVPLFNLVGPNWLFWFYASGTYASVVFYYYFVPETKGKSLKEIQTEKTPDEAK